MTVFLRPARPTDAGATGAILHQFAVDTPWMPTLHSGAETVAFCGDMIDRGWVMVAEDETGVLGFLSRDREEVHALYLDPSRTRQGIGATLIRDAMAVSDRLALWTFQANDGAQRFYLREGFLEQRRTDGADNDEGLPDIRYVWTKETRP